MGIQEISPLKGYRTPKVLLLLDLAQVSMGVSANYFQTELVGIFKRSAPEAQRVEWTGEISATTTPRKASMSSRRYQPRGPIVTITQRKKMYKARRGIKRDGEAKL